MAVSEDYKAFVADLFEPVGPVRIRAMFGGAGIYADLAEGPVMFGLIAFETVYLKVDDGNRADFEAAGMEPFVYESPAGKKGVMSYYQLPDDLYDDPAELKIWAQKALDAALRTGTASKKRKKKKAP